MDTKILAKMLSDKHSLNLKKLQYKYSAEAVAELLVLFKNAIYKTLPIKDFSGNGLVYQENIIQVKMNSLKLLFSGQERMEQYKAKALEEEIYFTLQIENIESTRENIQHIVKGYAPTNESESRIYGIKKGLDFIGNLDHKINEKNIFKLYQLSVGELLTDKDKLLPDKMYRHDSVYIVGSKIEHEGLPYQKLPEYMHEFIKFINDDNEISEIWKAAIIHFYLAYLHPYFDGNGRMARLLHLWYLVQQGYSAALFVPFSSNIYQSRKAYYAAYSLIEENLKISEVIDVTPFLIYFTDNVYNKLSINVVEKGGNLKLFQSLLDAGSITEKEKELWYFVMAAYGIDEFSTKQLEKDFGNAAYATIRSFVLKFTEAGLLQGQRYGNKVKYRAC